MASYSSRNENTRILLLRDITMRDFLITTSRVMKEDLPDRNHRASSPVSKRIVVLLLLFLLLCLIIISNFMLFSVLS